MQVTVEWCYVEVSARMDRIYTPHEVEYGVHSDLMCARAVTGRSAMPLTIDHKADRPDEVDRIRRAGGSLIVSFAVCVMCLLDLTWCC